MKDCVLRERLKKKKMSDDSWEHDTEDNTTKKWEERTKVCCLKIVIFWQKYGILCLLYSGSWSCLISSSINYWAIYLGIIFLYLTNCLVSCLPSCMIEAPSMSQLLLNTRWLYQTANSKKLSFMGFTSCADYLKLYLRMGLAKVIVICLQVLFSCLCAK